MHKSGDPHSFSADPDPRSAGSEDTADAPHHDSAATREPSMAAAADHAADGWPADAVARINELEERLRQQEDLYLRALADGENTRRRAQDEIAKAGRFAIDNFAQSLVPVKDSLEAALATPDQSLETLISGVEMTLKQLSGAFERHRLTEIAPGAGTAFDPNQHQAISSTPSEQPANSVVQTLQKGYLLAERVLRPALVVVSAPK